MRSFGWIAGIHYCPHLSDAATASFACVLGMPWASTTNQWDPANVPRLSQHTCETELADWLAPWRAGKVTWQLFAKDGANWTPVGQPRAITQVLDAATDALLRDRCEERLHAYVKGHADAMGFQPEGANSEVLSYPIVSPGIAHLPVHLSDALLGTSAVLEVDRTKIPANAVIIAVPAFHLAAGDVGPTSTVRDIDGASFEVSYNGPVRSVAGEATKFSGCVVNWLNAGDYLGGGEVFHSFLSIRSRTPDRQVYAALSRKFSPLRVWLAALAKAPPDTMDVKDFCATVVRLLGCGEDELVGALAVSSIYELVLQPENYLALFQVGTHSDRAKRANEILGRFDAELAGGSAKVAALLTAFSTHLKTVGMTDVAKRAADLAVRAIAGDKAGAGDIGMAKVLYEGVEAQTRTGRAMWAAWLAAVLPIVAPAATAGTVPAIVQALLEQVNAAAKDTTGPSAPVLEDDVLRILNGQIDYASGFWEKVHADEDLRNGLATSKALFTAAIGARVGGIAALAPLLGLEYDRALELVVQAARTSEPEADDPPLQLRYHPAPSSVEESTRGCILALRVGIPRVGNTVEWKKQSWITNFHAKPSLGNGSFGPVLTSGGKPAVFCDTQGSTRSDGLEEQVSVYSGSPLFAAEEVASEDESRSLPEVFRGKATGDSLPQLAFGACYGGISGTIDNSGVIIEESLREPGSPGNPVEALAPPLFETAGGTDAPAPFRYVSRQPPGAPVFSGGTDFGVGADTLSFHMARDAAYEHRSVVLFSGAGFEDQCIDQQVKVLAPSVGPTFMTRWLNADELVGKDDTFRWAPLKTRTVDEIKALREAASANSAPKVVPRGLGASTQSASSTEKERTQLGVSHPAVSHIELRVTWFSGNDVGIPDKAIKLVLRHIDGAGWRRDESFPMQIRQAQTTDSTKKKFVAAGDGVEIVVPRGMQARVEARAIIPKDLVEGDNARLSKDALANSAQPETRPYEWVAAQQEFVTRNPVVLWIESLPEVPADADLFDFAPAELKLVTPKTLSNPAEMRLAHVRQSPRSADWIVGVEMEAKRWQWSGYPVVFPIDGTLAHWLPLYAGTTDTMPTLPAARFSTELAGGQWVLKGIVMKPVALAAKRPASHMGMVVKAVPRFAKLLSVATKVRATAAYVYSHVLGVPRSDGKRLPPPVWNEAIPLPQTMVANGNQLAQSSRSNLLVLKDPLYNTADTAQFGGIAERLELDVVGTWHKPTNQPSIDESGPNPIFHKAPAALEPAAEFELDAPFGLGYDRVVGGRPAQTGALVRPSKTQGRWTLAKCRLRRMVLPELVLDTVITTEQLAILDLRQVDDGWIPEDFALLSSTAITEVKLGGSAIKMPVKTGSFHRAYLVTWHRDRWAASTPTWRPLVNLYARDQVAHEWKLKARLTPYQHADFATQGQGNGAIQLEVPPGTTTCRMDVSDFTESRWLTFIGGFGQEVPPSRDEMEVTRGPGDSYLLKMKALGAALPRLGASNALSSSLLLLFAPQLDVMRGRIESEGGELVGVYAASNIAEASHEAAFDLAILPCIRDPGDCRALVIQMQRHNVQSTAGYSIEANGWEKLVTGLFPMEEDDVEASLRLLPEYIGPMQVKR